MKKILILFHMGSEVRQFGHSGFIDSLVENGWQVLVGSHLPADEWQAEVNPVVKFVSIPKLKINFLYGEIAAGLDLAQNKRRKKAGLSTWSYGKKTPPKNFKHRAHRLLQSFLGTLFINPILFRWGQYLEAYLINRQGAHQFKEFLDAQELDAIIVNVPRFGTQTFFLSAAAKRNIPRFLFFHTNKDVVALSRLDHQFSGIGVWNEWMKEQLLTQNSHISEKNIFITGCAHFDCIGRDDWLIPPDIFRQNLGVDVDEKIVLYTAAGPGVVPAEERFIEVVLDALEKLPGIKSRLVVRLNPMDDSPRIEDHLKEKYPRVIPLRPDWHYSRTQNLCFQKKADAIFFNNLLHYADLCVNIPSTLTVECALAGLPVINVGFDLPGPQPVPGSIRAFWDVDYYANVRVSRSALFAESSSQLEELLQKSLSNKSVLKERQCDLIYLELQDIYPPDAHQHYFSVIKRYLL